MERALHEDSTTAMTPSLARRSAHTKAPDPSSTTTKKMQHQVGLPNSDSAPPDCSTLAVGGTLDRTNMPKHHQLVEEEESNIAADDDDGDTTEIAVELESALDYNILPGQSFASQNSSLLHSMRAFQNPIEDREDSTAISPARGA